MFTILLILFSVLIVLAIVGLVVYLILHKNKTKKASMQQANPVSPQPYPNQMQNGFPEPQNPYPMQQNGYPGQHNAFPSQPDYYNNNRLCIQCKGGVLDGKKFELQGELFIGRQPGRCQICYPADTGGISGVHCRLRKAGNVLELTDLGSSYGTFTKNGKLSPNQPVLIQPGESFWLADPINTFTAYN